ncbi:MAG: hypothetical protein ACK5IC_10595 [Moheibacter sp.]
MTKLKFLFLPILFLLTNCYVYKPYTEKEVDEINSLNKSNLVSSSSQALTLKGEEERIGKTKKIESEQKRKLEQTRKKEEAISPVKPSDTDKLSGRPAVGNKVGKVIETATQDSTPKVLEIKDKIRPNQYYKITVEDSQYKIQADQWEGDTLVSHILRKPERVLKFHKDQINEEALLERRFSKPYSDLLTVGAYVAAGAAVLLLVL